MKTLTDKDICGIGNNALIYRIDEEKVVKVLRYHGNRPEKAIDELEKERNLQRLVFNSGLPCPPVFDLEVFNIFPSKYHFEQFRTKFQKPGLIMGLVKGRNLDEFYTEEVLQSDNPQFDVYYQLSDEHDRVIEKARTLGFNPFDYNFRNTMVTPDRRLMLVDFYNWEYKGD